MQYTKPTVEPLGSIHSLTLGRGGGSHGGGGRSHGGWGGSHGGWGGFHGGDHDPHVCSPKGYGKCIGDGMS
jgi:hypothetical protein